MKKVMNEIINQMRTHNKLNYFIIGIDGLGGSGKTTCANQMKRDLIGEGYTVHLFHLDDFIYPNNIRYNPCEEEAVCYYHLQWRYDYLIEQILEPIANGLKINQMIELYRKGADTYDRMELEINPPAIVIVEGVFLQRTVLKPYMNFTVFLKISKDERLKRVLERDSYIGDHKQISEKYNRRYFPAEDMYEADYAPSECADIVLRLS